MPEEERLSHLMKGVAEEVYRYLLPRDIATTDQFIAECRRVVALQGRRVTASKFERLPNVTSLGDLGDVTDLPSLIRQIVREEVQRALAPPREEPRISSLEEIVKEEVDKVLAPMSGINTFPMESAARSAPRNYRNNTWYAPKVEASGSRVEVRDTNEWRTPDGTPVSFHCGRPGHVVRYCRDRRRLLDERRDEMYQDRARTMKNSGRNNNSNDADQRVNTRRYRSPSPSPRRGSSPGRSATRRASQSPRLVKMTNNYLDIKIEGDTIRALVDSGASYSVISERFRVELKKTMFAETDVVLKVADDKVVKSKGRCTLKLEVNGHPENFEFVVLENCSHDVILGWDFFKATNAVIDCGLGELQLDDLPDLDAEGRDDGVYAIQDFVIPGRSSQRISVVNRSLVGIVNMEVTCSKELFIRKDVIFPSSLIEFEEGIGKIWITNGGLQTQMIPKGMNLVFLPTMKNANKVQNRVKHRIHTGDHPPIKQRPYRVSKREREIMQKEVDTMLERKVIQPSESPWSAPVVLVKKKDGTWRFCVDFRRLNQITKKDVYPLPRIDDVLDHLSSARMMDNVLMGLKWNICLCYLDDIVVYSDTFEEHLERLSKVLSCLQQAGLTINPDKCLFGSTRIKILGHVVDKDGIQPDSEKVEAIKKFPVPKSVCDIQSYLGMCSYYRRFIKNFSKIAAPLQILLKKDQKFIWTQEQKDTFESLKKALMQKPVLGHFKESAITKLYTDASSYGLGAVLVQIQENQENPIPYASRKLSKAEKNYSTTERECLAVIWAIGKFRPYLYGRPFEVVSDHHSLCWLTGLKDPSGRLARWALKLQDFDATITYKSGVKHKDADCLSRYPLPESPALTSLTLIQPPETFDFSTPNEWPKWRKRFERYLVVSGMKKKEEADKIDLFMYLMGDRADDIFRTFKFEKEEEATKIDSVLKAFDSHFCVRKNIIYERAKFNSRIQEDREPVDEFITSLYKLADSCEFEGLHEQLIRDRIVVGVRDKALSERMQLDSELTLEKAVKMVRQQEAVRQQQVDLQRPSTSQKVNQVKFNSKKQSPKQQQQPSRKKEKSAKTRSRCPKCGGFTHREGQACRAEGQKCNLCSKTGHFANCCPDKQAKTAEVKAVSELDEEIGFLLEVSAVEDSSNLDNDEDECRRRWTAEIQVNGKKVKFKLDSQADVTCVPLCLFKKIMGQQRLVESDINIRAAEFSELQTVGMFISTLRNGNYEIKENIYVIRRLSEPLLSRRACELLNLARRIEVVATRINPIKEFPEVFEGLGQIGNPYEIKLKPGAKPYAVHTPRRVPIPLMEKLKTRLEELEKAGIIAQVNVATEWCAPTVIASKPNGDIRLCVDLSRLNEHVQREVHPMPVVEHVLGQLGEARFFSKLDANSGFHQIPLSPDCQHLTTFITPFGRYKYCRMPFGISLAPEYFQKVMSIILQGMDGVMCYLDDILIFASDSKTHDRILRLVLRKLKEAKVTLSKAKCVFGVPRINFLGHILDEDGIRPDPAKIEAVARMPAPTDVHGVRRFLGMVNHLGRKLRTTLPIAPENLNPKLVDSQTLKRKEGRRRKDMKSRYDRRCGATDMEELSEGDTVWITDMRTWGIVKQKASTPRSYMVDTPVGTLRRNRFHLRKGYAVQYPADPSTPTFSGEELVENKKTPVVDYPSNDSEDGQIRTR
ncbi:hypothetical protein LAZ67_X001038, partial [Cordylochernes scorpioides]